MSTKQIMDALVQLDGYGIVIVESDEELINAIETLGLNDEEGE